MLTIRRSAERGAADHGWLQSRHSFSFADYYDPHNTGFSALRVINEDRIAPGSGFGSHGHRDMEIISYVLAGELAHKDSMGNGSTIVPGDVQRMSAGKGVLHSEFNQAKDGVTHFLQIWIEPNVKGIAPSYEEKHFALADKRGGWRQIASPDGAEGSVLIHQDARVYVSALAPGDAALHALAPGRMAYLHVIRGAAAVNGNALATGDAARVVDEAALQVAATQDSELLLFDLPPPR